MKWKVIIIGQDLFQLLKRKSEIGKMIYNVNLLSVKDGKFGIIWFLGSTTSAVSSTSSSTSLSAFVAKKLKRKNVDKVVVRQMCSDILNLLPVNFVVFDDLSNFLSIFCCTFWLFDDFWRFFTSFVDYWVKIKSFGGLFVRFSLFLMISKSLK